MLIHPRELIFATHYQKDASGQQKGINNLIIRYLKIKGKYYGKDKKGKAYQNDKLLLK